MGEGTSAKVRGSESAKVRVCLQTEGHFRTFALSHFRTASPTQHRRLLEATCDDRPFLGIDKHVDLKSHAKFLRRIGQIDAWFNGVPKARQHFAGVMRFKVVEVEAKAVDARAWREAVTCAVLDASLVARGDDDIPRGVIELQPCNVRFLSMLASRDSWKRREQRTDGIEHFEMFRRNAVAAVAAPGDVAIDIFFARISRPEIYQHPIAPADRA